MPACFALIAAASPVRGHPAPSGAFVPLLQKSRSWSSAQVPGGQRPTDTVMVPRAGTPSAPLVSPFAVRCAHKGGIKPLCAVLCCVIPSLVCVTGNCALRGHSAPSGALRRGHNQCLWPRWGNIKGVPRAARCSGCRRPLSGIPRKSGVLHNENPAFFTFETLCSSHWASSGAWRNRGIPTQNR